MAGWDGAGSLYVVAMRVAVLNSSMGFTEGASGLYVSDSLVKVEVEPDYEDGDEKTQKNGAGRVCLNYKTPSTPKGINVKGLQLCTPDPDLEQYLAGGLVLTDSGDTVGYAMPAVGTDPTPNGVSIEFWTRAIVNGAPAAVNPYIQWVAPRVFLKRSSQTLQEDPLETTFEGFGTENPNWGNGPVNDWTLDSSRAWFYRRTSTLPTAQLGPQAIPSQA